MRGRNPTQLQGVLLVSRKIEKERLNKRNSGESAPATDYVTILDNNDICAIIGVTAEIFWVSLIRNWLKSKPTDDAFQGRNDTEWVGRDCSSRLTPPRQLLHKAWPSCQFSVQDCHRFVSTFGYVLRQLYNLNIESCAYDASKLEVKAHL